MGPRATVGEPAAIDPARFFDFVASATVAVVFVSVHPAHSFNQAVRQRLTEGDSAEVVFGTVSLVDLLVRGGSALPYLSQGLRDCGGPAGFGVMPGYWLFYDGRVLGWHAGLPTRADAPRIARKTILH